MSDSSNRARFLNPWVLHHQKLCLELKCPICLNLLNQPKLLPCNHIFCDFCVPRLTHFGSECPVCKQPYADRDVRPAPYMENLVAIYRSLDATLSASLFQPLTSDAGRVPHQSPVDNGLKESVETPQEGNSSNGQCTFPLTTNKRVWASRNDSVDEGNKLTGKSDKFTPPITSKVEEFKIRDGDGVVFHGGGKLIPSEYPCWVRGSNHKDLVTEEIDINQVLQSSPLSSHFFDAKGVNNDSSDPGSSNNSIEKHPAKRLVENNSDKAGADRTSPSAGEDHTRDVKRQKTLTYGLFDMGMKINGCTQPNVFHSESVATSKLESKFGELSGAKAPTISDSCDANKSICAFCQSSGLTDRTGPMLHYVNGEEVMGDAATHSNATHVHKICIEWTPQVYFVGETVKNLKAEVARAAKLKCGSCGLKGAALGCFVKSCRKSYHVPCAVEIIGCRWDFEDFLMLCPNHSLVKFPREKSKKFGKLTSEKQHFVPTEITSKQSSFWGASPNGMKEWVFCGSALSAEEKYLLVKFAGICGATVSKFWKPNVTHVIAATDDKGACSRTLKVLKAILNGRWILKTDWLKSCMEAMLPVDEEPYEVSLDNYGCCDGPKTGRLRALNNVPKLFNGLNFYFTGYFIPGYKEGLLDLVITAGGIVIESKEQLVAQSHDAQTTSVTLVVYNNDTMQECRLEEEGSVVLQGLYAAENLANEIGAQVIAHTWLLESIAASKLQPFGW